MSSEHINPDKCIACTICQVHCPVAKVTPNFLGPRLIGPAYERFRLLDVAEEESLHYCANCKNSDIAHKVLLFLHLIWLQGANIQRKMAVNFVTGY